MILTSDQKIQIVLANAVTATQLSVVTSWADMADDASTLAPGGSTTATNGTIAVDAVEAPANGFKRQLKYFGVFNADTAVAIVTLQINDNGILHIIARLALAVGARLEFSPGAGLRALDSNGALIGTSGTITKAMVGLSDVDNILDIYKPISIYQQIALDSKQDLSEKDVSNGYAGLTLLNINLKSVLGTVTSWITSAATSPRTWALPNKGGTIAMTSDITGINSNTNTGDQINITGNSGSTNALKSSTTTVDIVASPAPTVGQVLTAVAPNAATWQTPGSATTYYSAAPTTEARYNKNGAAVEIENLSIVPDVGGTYRVEFDSQFYCSPAVITSAGISDLTALVTQLNNLPGAVVHSAAFTANEVLTPGVYTIAAATTQSGNLVFNAQGNADALFVIRCGAAFATAAGATMSLTNGARACNIFWVINGAPTFGAGAVFKGTLIAVSAAIATGDGINLEGRFLSTGGAIATTNSVLNIPAGQTSLNLGILQNFALFTVTGAIGNTATNFGVGDIATGAGAITNYPGMIGTIYLPTDTAAKAAFGIYQNGVQIAASVMSKESRTNAFSQSVSCTALATIEVDQPISVKIKVDVGSFVVSNRNIFALKIS